MVQLSLRSCGLYRLLEDRENSVAKTLSGILISIEPEVAKTLEYIKVQFPSFTEHGIQHSLRIVNYIYAIMSEEMRNNISDVEIFCFIMSAFFHDMGMTLIDVDDKENQRANHHLYARKPIEEFFEKYLDLLVEKNRLKKSIIFICEAHGCIIEDIYNDTNFRKIEMVEGQQLRYGLLAILLRIGDLMDLEETRVCEFNMHINANYYDNHVSIQHNQRHLDDITYNYNPNRIYISVSTDDREKYKIWSQWLTYLDEEIMYANTHYLVGDNSDFFRNYKLPEVVKEVKPSENAAFSVEEIRFQVDDTGALWDILTKSIYTNEFDYIRELVQNAIDAILLKLYMKDDVKLKYQSPRAWECNDKVIVAYSQDQGVLWVDDVGIGMNENELSNYLFKTANSGYKHMKEREFAFPAIAKFGIGFVACLTKANKIKIVTCSQKDNAIKAEIESKGSIAFIEKNIRCNKQGTTVALYVRDRYSFRELKEYLMQTILYPSVGINLVDIDTLSLYVNESDLYDDTMSNISDIVAITERNREYEISKILPIYKCFEKITEILSEETSDENALNSIKSLLSSVFYESEALEKIRTVVNNATIGDSFISKVRREVASQRKELEEVLKLYPQFLFPISKNSVEDIVDYEQLIIEFNDEFNIGGIYRNQTIRKGSKGIIFISTSFTDFDLGIEWHSVNAFMFNDGKVVKNIIKVSADENEDTLFKDNIISLEEIGDADYEMKERLQEEEDEEYYHHVLREEDGEIYNDYSFTYDILVMKQNDFYKILDVEGYNIERVIENNIAMKSYRLFQSIMIPEKYKGERFEFGESRLYQDGILLNFNPECIVPMGICHIVANLTGKSRFDLNITRHELNQSREVLEAWNQRVGIVVQSKVAEKCYNVLKENNLTFKVSDLLSEGTEEYLAKKSILSIRSILNGL